MERLPIAIFILIILSSCSSKYVVFNKPQNEIYTTQKLSTFLKKNKNPKIVLRTPKVSKDATKQENISYLYSVIEKELLSKGFIVRDRNLFNEVVGNNKNTVDYSKLKTQTDTELIIELIKLDGKVLYTTNKFITVKDKEGLLNHPYKQYGASVEFKVVLIDSNEFAGIYKFNYAPCTESKQCLINDVWKKKLKKIRRGKETYEIVSSDTFEKFMRNATRELVRNMRE